VIDSFDQLFEATRPDFTPYYAQLHDLPAYQPGEVLPTDRLVPVTAKAA
jgi:phenylalanine-4-hydroxylase